MTLLNALMIWLQDPGAEPQQPSPVLNMMVMLFGVIMIFYLLAWRPQAKERKARQAMLQSLKTGDHVLLTSGLYGTLANVKEREVVVKVDAKNNIRLRFTRDAVQMVLRDEQHEEEGASS